MTDITSLAKRIRSKAEKATPGPWQQAHRKVYDTIHNEEWYRTEVFTSDGEPIAALAWYPKDEGNGVTGTYREDNAEYIALLHPDNVRALCDALAQRDAQIAALNSEAGMMAGLLNDICRYHEECTHDDQMYALIPLEYVSAINGFVERDVDGENPCPLTDAFLNALRAEGAEAVAAYYKERVDALSDVHRRGANDHKVAYMAAMDVANELREGKA